jgi:hypothetical protein
MVAACSAPSPHKQLAPPPPSPPLPPAPDAAIDAAVAAAPGGRGDPCRADSCGAGLLCAPLPGGYCASACGVTGTACDGACVETGRAGEVCAKSCTSDRDCRADEGYVCDPQWKACLVPNFAALVPRQCPTQTPARDLAFGDSEPWSTAAAPGSYQFGPSATLTDEGGLVVLYGARGARGEPSGLGVARSDGKGQRTIDVALGSPDANHVAPSIARDRKGRLHAVWLAFAGRESQPEIGLATSTDRGATWSAPIAVHDPGDCTAGQSDCLDRPMIVAGTDPKTKADLLHVLYVAGDNGLRVRTSRDGGKTFTTGPIVLAGTHGNATATADGRLHVVALAGGPLGGYGSAQHAVEYTVSSDGGKAFTQPVPVSGRDELLPFFFANPSLAVDTARGWLYVAYTRGGRDARWEIVLAVSKDRGATWKRKTVAGDGCAIHMVPNLALDPVTGTLHLAYYDSEGVPGRFVHATCGPGGTHCKVLGAINSQPFAVLSTARHSSKWVGEYEALVVDAKRRALHAVWSQTIDEAGKPITRIFHARAQLNK